MSVLYTYFPDGTFLFTRRGMTELLTRVHAAGVEKGLEKAQKASTKK